VSGPDHEIVPGNTKPLEAGTPFEEWVRVPLTAPLPDTGVEPLEVLVVDPNPAARRSLEAEIRSIGHAVEPAANRAEVRAAVAGRELDVVVAAVRPPTRLGLAILADLRRSAPAVAVVLIAEPGSIDDAIAATRAGAAYLAAPLVGGALADALAAAAGRRGRSATPVEPVASGSALVQLRRAVDSMRELEQAVRRELASSATAAGGRPAEDGEFTTLARALARFEREYLVRALERAGGSRSAAASLLGISRKSLWAKLKRFRAALPDLTVVS
jgi:DNA-binding NtrC family response regulator